jgi:hypothetical protein
MFTDTKKEDFFRGKRKKLLATTFGTISIIFHENRENTHKFPINLPVPLEK